MVARDIAWPLLEAGSKAKPMTYSEALALDLILRTADLPIKYYPTAGELDVPTPGRRLKEWTFTCMRPIGETSSHPNLPLNELFSQVSCLFIDHFLSRP